MKMGRLLKLHGFGVLHLRFVHSTVSGQPQGMFQGQGQGRVEGGVYFLARESVRAASMPSAGSVSGLVSVNLTGFEIQR